MRVVCIFTLLLFMLAVQTHGATGDDKNDLTTFLRTRDSSISSYAVSVKHAHTEISLDRYDQIKGLLGTLAEEDSRDEDMVELAARIMQGITPDRELNWRQTRNLQDGVRFKAVTSSGGQELTVEQYDGESYLRFQPEQENKQVDIYPEVRPVARWDFEDLNVTLRGMLKKEVLSFKEDEERSALTFGAPEGGRYSVYAEFNRRDAALRYIRFDRDKQAYDERWSMYHRQVDGYEIPQVIFRLRRTRDGATGKEFCRVWCYVVENVEINRAISDKELEVSGIPPWAVVIDHREDPPRTSYAVDTPRVILRDEMMLSALEKTDDGGRMRSGERQPSKAGDSDTNEGGKVSKQRPGAYESLHPTASAGKQENRGGSNTKLAAAVLLGCVGAGLAVIYVVVTKGKSSTRA
ncbi:MAG: hypothetical protein JSU94_15900 [Phycisphaerales bacterium]|nr:MAG: hypothetical protein JSU94_15900 [Phycisphaerales bacterium]